MSLFAALRFLRPLAAAAVVSFALAAPGHAEPATPLVSTGWLKQHLQDPDVVVLDVRSAIDGGGAEAFAKGHIPGAVHSDYDKAGWRVTRGGVPFMLPTLPELEKLIGETGIDEDTHVVVVPAGVHHTDFGAAARTYWTLKVAGVSKVSILDGGYRGLGRGEERGRDRPVKPSPKIFTATLNKALLAEVRRSREDRAIGRRDVDRLAARIVLFRQAEGARREGLRAYSGRRERRQRDVLRYRCEQAEAAGRACSDRIRAAGRPGRRLLQHRPLGGDRLVRALRASRPQGRAALLRLDGGLDQRCKPPAASTRTKWDDLKKTLGFGS